MNDTEPAAPLATLDTMIGESVTVRTKAGELIDGTFAGYDEHLNLTLGTGPSTDGRDTDDDHRLIRGNRVVAITHPPIDREDREGPDDTGDGALLITKLGQEYRVRPDGTVEGDGLHRKHLERFFSSPTDDAPR